MREAMDPAEEADLCEHVERTNATAAEVLDVFQAPPDSETGLIFHFGGHAGSAALLFESAEGAPQLAHPPGFARFLGEQRRLTLVAGLAGRRRAHPLAPETEDLFRRERRRRPGGS